MKFGKWFEFDYGPELIKFWKLIWSGMWLSQ